MGKVTACAFGESLKGCLLVCKCAEHGTCIKEAMIVAVAPWPSQDQCRPSIKVRDDPGFHLS